jgi:short-subunit dehydrogenase
VLLARDAATLETVARECRERGGSASVAVADVTDEDAVRAAARRAVAEHGRLDVWVNNAGVVMFATLAQTRMADLRRLLDVNVVGMAVGAQVAMEHFRATGRGVVVNVASAVTGGPQPYTGAYVASKHAVRALSGSLRQEVRLEKLRGVSVCTVLPATTDTPIFANAANRTGRAVRVMPPVYPPEEVAQAVVRCVDRPKAEVYAGGSGRGLAVARRLAPGLVESFLALAVHRLHLAQGVPSPGGDGNLHAVSAGHDLHGGWRTRAWRRAVRRGVTGRDGGGSAG